MKGELTQNVMSERHVRIGTVDVFVAPENTPFDAETGWEWLGVMEAGSQQYEFPPEMFQLRTGYPQTTKIEAVIGIDGNIQFNLEEYHALAVDVAAGGAPMTKEYATTTPAPDTVAAAPVPTTSTFALEAAAAGVKVGQRIEVETPNGLEDTYIEDYDPASGTVTVKPALSAAPEAGAEVKWIKQYVKPIGGVDVPKRAFKSVFTDKNLEKAIVYCPCVASTGGYRPNFADARSNAKLPVQLRAYGKEETIDGKVQPVVGKIIHLFPDVT
ncbi:hypothetical protein D3C72_721620 [compost metagenome]